MLLLNSFLEKFIIVGCLKVIFADGSSYIYGTYDNNKPVTIRINNQRYYHQLATNPQLYLGEGYMNKDFEIIEGDLWSLLEICGKNYALLMKRRKQKGRFERYWIKFLQKIKQHNSRRYSKSNIAHHYDLSRKLYESFLDKDMQYSCAYFQNPDMSLEDAQIAKKRHIAAKLLLKEGQKILDIGCGWGGMGLSLAQIKDTEITGITLSREQLQVANERADKQGLNGRVKFLFKDYRDISEKYDRIVSVGMFEHVGVPYYEAFFERINRNLKSDGVMLLHTIGSANGAALGNEWISKYIFPGGYVPSLSEVTPAIEKAGLIVTDIEILRLHYAETLRHWRERFIANWDSVKSDYDDTFFRMWEFYLAVSEMGFRYLGISVFQIQIAKNVNSVPITRDYITKAEENLKQVIK